MPETPKCASRWKKIGQPIGHGDLLIAAHTQVLTLATDSVRAFSRLPGLRVENWLTEPSGTGPAP